MPTQHAALTMLIWMFVLSSYEHLPFNDQLSSDGRGTGAHLRIWNQIPKSGVQILEFEEQIRGTPILFAIFVSESEIRNHSNSPFHHL
jgi:hypothetical protein